MPFDSILVRCPLPLALYGSKTEILIWSFFIASLKSPVIQAVTIAFHGFFPSISRHSGDHTDNAIMKDLFFRLQGENIALH